MFWASNGRNKLPERRFKFPFNQINKNGQWYLKQANHGTYSNPGTHVGGRNKDFGTVLQTDLTRSLVPSSAQAIG